MEDRSGSVDPIFLLRLFDFWIRSHGKQKNQYNKHHHFEKIYVWFTFMELL